MLLLWQNVSLMLLLLFLPWLENPEVQGSCGEWDNIAIASITAGKISWEESNISRLRHVGILSPYISSILSPGIPQSGVSNPISCSSRRFIFSYKSPPLPTILIIKTKYPWKPLKPFQIVWVVKRQNKHKAHWTDWFPTSKLPALLPQTLVN